MQGKPLGVLLQFVFWCVSHTCCFNLRLTLLPFTDVPQAAHAQRERLLRDLRVQERSLAELTASLSTQEKVIQEADYARQLQRIQADLTLPSIVVASPSPSQP